MRTRSVEGDRSVADALNPSSDEHLCEGPCAGGDDQPDEHNCEGCDQDTLRLDPSPRRPITGVAIAPTSIVTVSIHCASSRLTFFSAAISGISGVPSVETTHGECSDDQDPHEGRVGPTLVINRCH